MAKRKRQILLYLPYLFFFWIGTKLGQGYREMEEDGVYSPVVSISCDYKKPTDFGDEIRIEVAPESLSPLRVSLRYTMKRDGVTVATAASSHCFLNREGKFVNIEKNYPAAWQKLREMME